MKYLSEALSNLYDTMQRERRELKIFLCENEEFTIGELQFYTERIDAMEAAYEDLINYRNNCIKIKEEEEK